MMRRAPPEVPPAWLVPAAFLLQASWNYERQQGLGFGAAMAGAAAPLGLDGAEKPGFLRRHLRSFNTNPVMAPWVIGVVARLEADRARDGAPPAEEIDRLKTALSVHLARLGDSLVWTGIRPLASAVGIALALAGLSWGAALAYWMFYNAVQVPLRVAGLSIGYGEGASVIARLTSPRWNRWLAQIRTAGAAVAGVAAGLVAARTIEHGPATARLTALAAIAAAVAVERWRGGATGVALLALVGAAVLAAAGLR